MSKRLYIQFQDIDGTPVITLLAVRAAPGVPCPEAAMRALLDSEEGARSDHSAIVEQLLAMRHARDQGPHFKGDRIFWLVPPSAKADDANADALVVLRDLTVNGPGSRVTGWKVQ